MVPVDPPSRIIIAGHSHVAALGVSLSATAIGLEPIAGAPDGFCGLAGPWTGTRDAAYWEALAEAARDRTAVINWSGNEHNALFLLHTPPAFDFHLGDPRHDRIAPDALILPKLLVEARLDAGMAALTGAVRLVKAHGPAALLVLGTPPPKRDLSGLAHVIAKSDFWRSRAGEIGQDSAQPIFTPPHLRLKLWAVLQERMAAAAQAGGGEFVPVPAEVQDDDGFLRPDLWADDLTHANRDYGRIVLDHLAALEGVAT
jgi:hypothetical protein